MKNKKKDRTLIVSINTLGPASSISAVFNKDEQSLKIKGIKPLGNSYLNKINVRSSYKKENGKCKILNDISLDKKNLNLDLNEAIFDNYNMIFGCDTNYKIIGKKKICVSCLTILSYNGTTPDYHPIKALVFYVPEEMNLNPEKVGWKHFVDFACSGKKFPLDRKIGFVIDSDYGNLNDYNLGRKEIIDGFKKPENVTFIYASSDNGKDYIINKTLSAADKYAKEILNKLLESDNSEYLKDIPNFETPTELFRPIKVNDECC